MINQRSLFENAVCPPINSIPYGLPYQGCKRAIANQLMQTMHQIKPKAKYFYDLFGGGATMSAMALQWGFTVFYNELDLGIYNLVTFLKSNPVPPQWYEPVSREQFHRIKNLTDPKSVAQSLCWSFSNNRLNYLWSTQIEALKMNLYIKKIHSLYPQIYKPSDYIFCTDEQAGQTLLESAGRLQSLNALRRLESLRRLERWETSNLSFADVYIRTDPAETIIYLDPPYRGCTGYKTRSSVSSSFTALVDKYMADSPYTVFMSEYDAPFQCVGEYKRRALMGGTQTNQNKKERLFWNGK